jgi:hypothetical protein
MNWLQKIAHRLCMYNNCVGWPENLMPALQYIIDNGDEIDRDDFLRHADVFDPEEIPADDWHIWYGKVSGFNIYYFVHSGIEHVFAGEEEILKLNSHALQEGY